MGLSSEKVAVHLIGHPGNVRGIDELVDPLKARGLYAAGHILTQTRADPLDPCLDQLVEQANLLKSLTQNDHGPLQHSIGQTGLACQFFNFQ